ncbi:OmpA family protein [Pontibacter silvestris]|uniref:OmpA family protein n=1 Tax=Pontibacter silvestris TaxID=2305183 RepID=A0ABW4WZN1_9BACT|nr:OmpA family protein [Pontibacter silvestris]MCC9135551.1 OmpA family protein [Pontibacter silvestris]
MAVSVSAQSTGKLLRTGKKLFDRENYREAVPYYEEVLANDPNNAKALYYAGISYMTFDKEKAADYLYRVQQINPNIDRDLEYWLGRVEHINYRFDRAIEHFQSYQPKIRNRDDWRREEVAMLIQHARNAKREASNPKDIFVKNLGETINTAYSEHSPVIASDDNYLLFTSRSAASTGQKEAQDGEYFEDIFESTRTGEAGEWGAPQSIAGALSSTGHDASIQIFDNDTKMLLYRSVNNGDIMVSERQPDGQWGTPKSISNRINSSDFESDAYITPDGQTIFFSTSHYSNRGDLDIYTAKRQSNGEWGKPESLGSTINTSYDDDSPYLAADGTLYFSSRGHNTMGGYDIFSARYDSIARRWARPENLGSPVNTPDDDTYYRLSPDGSYAYLSSYRTGGYGEKDIYTINYIRTGNVKGKVFAQGDSVAIPGVELIFNATQADRRPIAYRDVTRPDSAAYDISVLSGRKYQVQLSVDNKLIATEEFDMPVVLDDTTTVTKNFYIAYEDAGDEGGGININAGITAAGERIAAQRLYFDTDEYMLRPESTQNLDDIARLMESNPDINLSIEGHTDSRASNSYNVTLGQNRADAAYDYLISKGISPKRLVTVTYGESRPVVPNTSAENMQLNRRTVFKVLSREDDSEQ